MSTRGPYTCPHCQRPVAYGASPCPACGGVVNWANTPAPLAPLAPLGGTVHPFLRLIFAAVLLLVLLVLISALLGTLMPR